MTGFTVLGGPPTVSVLLVTSGFTVLVSDLLLTGSEFPVFLSFTVTASVLMFANSGFPTISDLLPTTSGFTVVVLVLLTTALVTPADRLNSGKNIRMHPNVAYSRGKVWAVNNGSTGFFLLGASL